jgi:hypothetical protein
MHARYIIHYLWMKYAIIIIIITFRDVKMMRSEREREREKECLLNVLQIFMKKKSVFKKVWNNKKNKKEIKL